jgi:hypothetical protein
VEWLSRVEHSVPIGDDDNGDSVVDEHLHRRAEDCRTTEKLRLVNVGDVEHHEAAILVQVIEAVAVEAIKVRLLHGAGLRSRLTRGGTGGLRRRGRVVAF